MACVAEFVVVHNVVRRYGRGTFSDQCVKIVGSGHIKVPWLDPQLPMVGLVWLGCRVCDWAEDGLVLWELCYDKVVVDVYWDDVFMLPELLLRAVAVVQSLNGVHGLHMW